MMRFFDGRFSDRFDRLGNMGGGWILMAVFGLVILAAVVIGVLLLVKLAKRHPTYTGITTMPPAGGAAPRLTPDNARALEILNERLAKGEVNDEEYERIKGKLKE